MRPPPIFWFGNPVPRAGIPKPLVVTAAGGDAEVPQGGGHRAATGGKLDATRVGERALPGPGGCFGCSRRLVLRYGDPAGQTCRPEPVIVMDVRSHAEFAENGRKAALANSRYQITQGIRFREHLLPCHVAVHKLKFIGGV